MASNQVLELIAAAHRDRATKLDISGQNLTELPDSVCEIDSLVELDLSNNQLIALPNAITNLTNLRYLNLKLNYLLELPENIGDFPKLGCLNIARNPLTELPESLGNLVRLTRLFLGKSTRTSDIRRLPASIGNLVNLKELFLQGCQLTEIPECVWNLTKLQTLNLHGNKLRSLPDGIGNLTQLIDLTLRYNQITELPRSMSKLAHLNRLDIRRNPISTSKISFLHTLQKLKELKSDFIRIRCHARYLAEVSEWKSEWLLDEKLWFYKYDIIKHLGIDRISSDLSCISKAFQLDLNRCEDLIEDLSVFQSLQELQAVWMFGVKLPRRYWKNCGEWKAEWLLDENNAEIRRRLIEKVGYEKICDELGAIEIDSWHEYTLLKIDNMQIVYQGWQEVGREPMMLLKMTCPSTAHIHILRVPPDMTSAEDAIVWINHGIHPSKFAVQT